MAGDGYPTTAPRSRARRLAWGSAGLGIPMVISLALLQADKVPGLSVSDPLGVLIAGGASLVMGAAIIWTEKNRERR